jgi:hypothetical protein
MNSESVQEQFNFSRKYRVILIIIMITGLLVSLASVIILKPAPSRIWANILLNNQFFVGLSLGAAFFLAVHRIALSGWHTAIQRIPDAMTSFLPVAFILMLLIYFGMHDIFHWTHYEGYDKVLEGKKPWLNIPFFFIRMVIYFTGWIILTRLMRKSSDALQTSYDIKYHNRRKLYAGLFLVFYAITVSASSWDWIMSLEAHWFSTIFGWYVLIGMFVTSLAFITLLLWLLKRMGYLKFVRPDHIHDMGILLFSFSIFWTYLWFAQYELIWYGHLPEETTYYMTRLNEFKPIFFINLGVNFLIPFFGLIRLRSKRQTGWMAVIATVMLAGHWLDYWLMIMPAAAEDKAAIGLLEVFMTVFYLGMFLFIVLKSISRSPLIVKNDPFLEESMNYES